MTSPSPLRRKDQLYFYHHDWRSYNKSATATYCHRADGWKLFGQDIMADYGDDLVPPDMGIVIRASTEGSALNTFWKLRLPE
ncbi:MAG: hypothetical protein LBV12_03050 [Puniceicoccales bacterium]|jgi:hypothetical protein|nr:hypothetical protein [Puniceicoccales bacterium]